MMKKVTILQLVTLVAILSLTCSTGEAIDVGSIFDGVFKVAKTTLLNGQTDFLGFKCLYSVRPLFQHYKLLYRGNFLCPGLAPFNGVSTTKSQPGAISVATKDFAKKALANNLFTEKELSPWLAN